MVSQMKRCGKPFPNKIEQRSLFISTLEPLVLTTKLGMLILIFCDYVWSEDSKKLLK